MTARLEEEGMTTRRGLGSIHDILSRLAQTDDANTSMQALRQMLLDMSAEMPPAHYIRLYRLGHESALLRAATDNELPSGSFQVRLKSNALFTQVLETLQPANDPSQKIWVAPLYTNDAAFGLFEIRFEQSVTIDDTLNEWLHDIARTLATALHARTADTLLRGHARASAALSGCTNFREMAEVIAETMLSDGMMVSINLFEHDDEAGSLSVRTVATSNRYESFETNDVITFSNGDRSEFIRTTIEQAKPVALYSIADNDVLHPSTREWLRSQGVKGMHSFPMRQQERVVGYLAVTKLIGPLYLDPQEVLAYQSLADQISILTRAQHLADETKSSRNLNQRRTQAFNELSAGQDYVEMAEIIARHMLQEPGRYLAITLVRYNTDDVIEGLSVLTTANRYQAYRWDEDITFAWQGIGEGLRETMLNGQQAFSNNLFTDDARDFLGEAVHDWFTHDLQIEAFANFPIMVAGRPIAFLTMMSRTATHFTPDEIDAFHNLADQMAALIHAHNLLQEAENARQIANSLVEASRLIATSQDNRTMLTALLDVLPQNVSVLGISLFDRAIVPGDIPIRMDTEMVSMVEDVAETKITDIVPQDEPRLPMILEQFHAGEMFIARLTDDYRPVMTANALRSFREQGIQEVASIGLRSGERLYGVMFFGAQEAILVGAQHTDNLRTVANQIAITLDNRALFEQAQHAATELSERVALLQTLQEMAMTINTSQDRQLLLNQATQGLVNLLKIDHCSIIMLNPDGVTGTVVAEYPAEYNTVGVVLDVEKNNPIYQNARKLDPSPVVINDVKTDPIIDDEDRKIIQSFGIQSMMVLPLIAQQKFIGSIGLDVMRDSIEFTPEMIRIAEAIRTEISVGLNKINLLDNAQRYAEQMQQITAFSQSVQATLDIESILRLVLEKSSQMLPHDRMSITLFNESTGKLHVVARYMEGEMFIDLDTEDVGRTEGTVLGHAWETRQFIYIPDQTIDPNFPEPGTTYRALMVMPIQTGNRSYGTVNIGAKQANAYSETDMAVFVQMVNQFAVALENAQTYAQSMQIARNKALVNEITSQLQTQRDIDTMLNITAKEVGKALGAKRARIRLGTYHDENGA